jgi:hypothetical protein
MSSGSPRDQSLDYDVWRPLVPGYKLIEICHEH